MAQAHSGVTAELEANAVNMGKRIRFGPIGTMSLYGLSVYERAASNDGESGMEIEGLDWGGAVASMAAVREQLVSTKRRFG